MKKLPQDKIFFKSQNRNVFSVDPKIYQNKKNKNKVGRANLDTWVANA